MKVLRSSIDYLSAHDKIQDRFSLNSVLLCDTLRGRRITWVSRDNNNAVINLREVSRNNDLIMHAKRCRNSRVEWINEIELQHSRSF